MCIVSGLLFGNAIKTYNFNIKNKPNDFFLMLNLFISLIGSLKNKLFKKLLVFKIITDNYNLQFFEIFINRILPSLTAITKLIAQMN
jgi:hypothetical protein